MVPFFPAIVPKTGLFNGPVFGTISPSLLCGNVPNLAVPRRASSVGAGHACVRACVRARSILWGSGPRPDAV